MLNAQEHSNYLRARLEAAEGGTSILISTVELSVRLLESLTSEVTDALERGARIDVLWSRSEDPAIDFLQRLAFKCKNGELRGAVRFNQSPAPVAERVVVSATGTQIEANFGSFDWLGDPVGGAIDVSVRLRAKGLIAALLRCVAGRWASTESEALAGGPDSWRRLASDLELGAADEPGNNCEVSLVVGAGQTTAARELLRDATRRGLVTRPQDADDRSTEELLQLCTAEVVTLLAGTPIGAKNSFAFEQVAGLRASVVIADDRALISATPPFAPSGTQTRGAAVVIGGGAPAGQIVAALSGYASSL